ncbi:NUDIX domain-containing protein [Deinococcus sp. KSM4-11]|uniref:NUDIX domain-containing protein n=1 Tax=Deinococcus sp. KSM4-11 TaxID=2568654 RepID=UPI0010A54AFF|nr:NUDIX domain-containing protein [Deinococcus sp. KSM4-11]THF86252.1 NUDIX domain-containing protein [Deinococcus sp. KSM4-11]
MTFHLVSWLIVQDWRGRVLLGRRSGTSYGEGEWGLPGGRVEAGEALAAAAVREAFEEVGIVAEVGGLDALGLCRYDHAGAQGADVFFRARTWTGEPRPLDKTSEVAWFDPHVLPPDALWWVAGVLRAHLLGGARLSELLDGWTEVRVLV